MGPMLDLVMRRTHLASDDLMKAATKTPKALKVIKINNTCVVIKKIVTMKNILILYVCK